MQPGEPVLGNGAKYIKIRDAGIGGCLEKLSTNAVSLRKRGEYATQEENMLRKRRICYARAENMLRKRRICYAREENMLRKNRQVTFSLEDSRANIG